MKKERKEKHFIKKPVYSGGQKALNAFVYKSLKYPREALKAEIEGSVYLRYSIDPSGKVVETKVISSLGYGCDEEAQRVIKLLRFQVDKVHKRRVLFHKKIRVWFKRPEKPKSESTNITYQIKPADKTKTASKSYHYSIKI